MTIRQCFFCRGLLAVILSAFLAPCHAHSGKARFHAVVDTDGAADDLRTLCMLLGNREVEVLAVTTSEGALLPDSAAVRVRALLDSFYHEGVPVGAGRAVNAPAPAWRAHSGTVDWGDAFNVYDKRIDRANSEMSKGVLNQTMTIDSGSSLSQSEVHLEVFGNVCAADATMVKNIVNDKLIPLMIEHGFPLQGLIFDWDEAASFTPSERREMERVVLQYYDVDPQYFIDRYKIPITAKRADGFFE